MPGKLNEKKWPKTTKTLIIWSSTIPLFISVFFPVEYFKSNALKGVAWGHKMIDERGFITVLQETRDNYTESFVNTGIDKALKDFCQLPPSDMASHGGPLKYFISLFQNIVENLNYWLYMIIHRLTLDMYWSPYMTVVAMPSLFAGIIWWMTERYSFGYANPFLSRRNMVLIGWGVHSILLSLFIPLFVPLVIGTLIMIVMIPIGLSLPISSLPRHI